LRTRFFPAAGENHDQRHQDQHDDHQCQMLSDPIFLPPMSTRAIQRTMEDRYAIDGATWAAGQPSLLARRPLFPKSGHVQRKMRCPLRAINVRFASRRTTRTSPAARLIAA
jgi:hypothetical protein